MAKTRKNAEQQRLDEAAKGAGWRKWGPYLSERQWGTVREDFSADGDAWAKVLEAGKKGTFARSA